MTALYAWLASLAAKGALPQPFAYAFFARGLLSVCLLAPLLGGISHLVVARRLAFFSSALGQAALTGLAIGIVLGEPLNAAYSGIFGFCFVSALAMVYVKRRAALPADTLVGVFLSLTLGLGICLLGASIAASNYATYDNCWQYQMVQTPRGYYKRILVNVCQ